MSITTMPHPGERAPKPKRWTVAEFHRLWGEGWFEGRKAMLLDGEILDMPLPGPPHDQGVGLADYAIRAIFASGFWVRVQQPLMMGLATDAVPDVAVVPRSPRDYPELPRSALLVIEVADSSLDTETGRKALLYAAGGIADYWVVDLNARQLVVFRDPQPDATFPTGFRYARETVLDASASVRPLAVPTATFAVADLLP
jgi:Uma2 family endonuclease